MEPSARRLTICPECGSPGDRTERPVWSRVLGIARWLPVSLAALALVGAGLLAHGSFWRTPPGQTWSSSGPAHTWPIAPRDGGLSLRQVRAIADGTHDWRILGRECERSIRPRSAWDAFAGVRLYARFSGPTGTRHEHLQVGWPAPWLTWSHDAMYSDAFAKEGPQSWTWDATGRRWSSGPTVTAPSVSWLDPHVPGIALGLLLVVAAGHGASGATRLLARRKPVPAGASAATRKRRRITLVAAGAMLAILGGMSLLVIERHTWVDLDPPIVNPWPGGGVSIQRTERSEAFDTRLSAERFTELVDSEPGVREIARALAGAAPHATPAEAMLELGFHGQRTHEPTAMAQFGWPDPWVGWMDFRVLPRPVRQGPTSSNGTDPGAADSGAAPGSVSDAETGTPGPPRSPRLLWHWRRAAHMSLDIPNVGDPPRSGTERTYRTITLSLDTLAVPLLGAWLIWAAASVGVVGVRWRTVRRRLQRGLCVVCGYDLRLPDSKAY